MSDLFFIKNFEFSYKTQLYERQILIVLFNKNCRNKYFETAA